MKYLFVVSMAVFAFAISCAKKDNKPNVGKPTAAAVDCTKKENKDNKTCVDQAKKDQNALAVEKVETQDQIKPSGAAEAKDVVDTIPNLKDFNKMGITLSNKTALIAEIKSNAFNNFFIASKIGCLELKDSSKLEDLTEANPDGLTPVKSKIYLFNNSSIVAQMKVNKGDATGDSGKFYMLTCNSGSSTVVKEYLNDKNVQTRNLKKGQNAFEVVAIDSKGIDGIVTSFECNDDDQVLTETQKIQETKVINRIRLRKGSAVFVSRAVNYKIGEKILKDFGTEAQKEKQHSIIACEG